MNWNKVRRVSVFVQHFHRFIFSLITHSFCKHSVRRIFSVFVVFNCKFRQCWWRFGSLSKTCRSKSWIISERKFDVFIRSKFSNQFDIRRFWLDESTKFRSESELGSESESEEEKMLVKDKWSSMTNWEQNVLTVSKRDEQAEEIFFDAIRLNLTEENSQAFDFSFLQLT